MTDTSVSVAPELHGVVRPGVLFFDGLRVRETDPAIDAALRAVEGQLRANADRDDEARGSSGLVRSMYWRVGLDPTRRRPSSEALLRRVLKGTPLPRVNTLVDVCNWCSAEFQVPYGVYDADRVDGDVEFRLGREGEQYAGIRKDAVHVASRLAVADRLGAFGNPTSDSARTMVGPETTRALVVVYAPHTLPSRRLDLVLARTADRILAHAGGRLLKNLVV